jgi:hypothetical protein
LRLVTLCCCWLALMNLTGCAPDLGECDMPAAKKVVYSGAGIPYYEGQALVHQSCANGVCHAAAATRDFRVGAPHGLNFDVSPLQPTSTAGALSVLTSGIDRIRDEAAELYDAVEGGEMPPGEAGERDPLAWKTLDATTKPTVAAALPDVRDGAGQDVLRNWLACDAPIVAGVTGAPAGTEKLGDILAPGTVMVEPTFASIFTNVLSDTCSACHNGAQFTDQQALDFSTADAAFASLVGPESFVGGMCDGSGALVAPSDCEGSVLYQKLAGVGPAGAKLCGAPMPIGADPVSAQALEAICQWIEAGATK